MNESNLPPGGDNKPKKPPKVRRVSRGRITTQYSRRKHPSHKLTKEQRAKVAQRLAAGRAKAKLNSLITVTLTIQHTRNGVNYGPGTGELPRALALELLAEEQTQRKVEARFQGAPSFIIGPRSKAGKVKVVEVPAETFEIPYDNPNLYADRIDGKKYGSDTGEGGKF